MTAARRGEAVPSKDYALQYRPRMAELLREVERVLLEEEPILGASVERFEEEFARFVGVRHAVGVNTGTDALLLSLRALGVGPGDEVITASNTFLATVTAIALCGAKPVLVDPDPASLLLAADGVERALTPRTKALVPVHLYGRLCPMRELGELCGRRGVPIVEDAAQAHGARGFGSAAGAFGAAGAFSFHPSKNLGAFGDGGIVTCDDAARARTLRELRHLGKQDEHRALHVAPNSKLDTLQAALLRFKLPGLDAANRRRRDLARLYARALAGVGDLELPALPLEEEHVFHLYVVRTARRDALRAFLADRGIRASVHYPIPPHLQPALRSLGHREGDFPIAEASARSVLSLPIAPELTDAQIGQVCEAIHAFFAR